MAISFKTESGDFGVLNITGSNEAKFSAGLGSSGDNYLERAYITGSDGSWIKLDNSADVWEVDGSKVYYTGGNVGIGTTNPVSPLQVHNTDGGTVARFTRSGDSFGSSYLFAVTELANENAQLDMQNNGGLSKIRLSTTGANYFDGADGKLGIGTTDPDSKLEVDDDFDEFNPLVNIYNRATSTGKGLRVRAGNNSGDYIATFVTRSAIDAFHIAGNGSVGIGTDSPIGAFHVQPTSDRPFTVSTTGYVGIGVGQAGGSAGSDLSQYHLELASHSLGGPTLGLHNYQDSLTEMGKINFLIGNSAGTVGAQIIGSRDISDGMGSSLRFGTKPASVDPVEERMIITNSGNVGIGTTDPSNNADLTLGNDGSLCLKETTTPTADANFGKIYTKSDNNLYFQDGAGAENSISLGGGASWSSAPASGTAAGNAGDRAYDSNYYYVCVATNTWKRTSLATW
jgi:hypothetical protein